MQAEPDALSDKLKPLFNLLAILAALVLFGWPIVGLLNLFLGREHTVTAQLSKWDVQVGRRANVVTSVFEGNGKTCLFKAAAVAPVKQGQEAELVLDGLFWDEVVEIRQAGQVVWKRN